MSAVVANKPVRFIGIFSIVVGVIMILAGAGVYIYASNTLRVQNMTVSAVTPEEPGALADKVVAGPFTALAQANAINHHALAATGDRSYSDLGADVNAAKAQFAELVGGDEAAIGALNAAVNARNAGPLADLDISDEARAVADTAIADQTLRMGTSINGSLLQSALFTSVMAFGVAVLVMGIGLMFVLFGWVFTRIAPATVTAEV